MALASLPSGASVGIPPRNVTFSHPASAERFPFFDGNALASLLFVVFSGVFPPGERFFVASVRRFRDRIDDPIEKARVAGFCAQESLHGREHEKLNDYFRARGLDPEVCDRYVKQSLRQLERLSPEMQLACTTFMEHFTALLAEQWLTSEEFQKTSDPEMLDLWFWHALEELEHKSVAYDVFEKVDGRRSTRLLAGPIVLLALIPAVFGSWGVLLAREGELASLRSLRENRRGWRMLFGKRGFLAPVLARLPDFFARDFHPDHRDTRALAEAWRKKLFGEEGSLTRAQREIARRGAGGSSRSDEGAATPH